MSGLVPVSATAPAAWASYLINGDASGLEEDERALADRFAEWLGASPCDCGEEFFAHRHDATQFGVLPATVCTYTALIRESGHAS